MKVNTTFESGARPYRMTARAEAARETAHRVLVIATDLFGEKPYEEVTLGEVAERANVAVRTVIRRFGSKEALFAEAMRLLGEQAERDRDMAAVGDVAGAVRHLVDQYERWGDHRLRMLLQEDRIPVIADTVAHGRRYHWSWVERTFAPMLVGLRGGARKRRRGALIVATDIYTWKLLRRDLGSSRADTERTILEIIQSIAGDSTESP